MNTRSCAWTVLSHVSLSMLAVLSVHFVPRVAVATEHPPTADEGFEQHGVHEHGKVTLNAVVESSILTIELNAPAINVVGFEHEPRTQGERAAVRDAETLFRSSEALFGVPRAAQCLRKSAEVKAPEWKNEAQERKEHEHAGHGGQEHHADYEVRFMFHCAEPAKLEWMEPWLLGKLRNISAARVNVITASGQQRSETVKDSHSRISLR